MRAIALDCDYLGVPSEYADLAQFAACAVAAMKANSGDLIAELGLPAERRGWTEEHKEAYTSLAFRRGTEALIAAANGVAPWPGENGEAVNYWRQVEADTKELAASGRITVYRGAVLFDGLGVNRYIDPRAWLRSAAQVAPDRATPIALTLRHSPQGASYVLGSDPAHPHGPNLDYSTAGVWKALTAYPESPRT